MEPDYAVGVPEIDAQHQELENLVAAMRTSIADPDGQHLIRPAIKRLNQLLINHFDYEESLMQMVGYPDLPQHKKMHNGVLKLFRDCLEKPPEAGDYDPVGRVIGEKVLDHIKEHDLPLAAAIRKYLAENAIRAG